MRETKTIVRCDVCGATIWEGIQSEAPSGHYILPLNFHAIGVANPQPISYKPIELCCGCEAKLATLIESCLQLSVVQGEGLHVEK